MRPTVLDELKPICEKIRRSFDAEDTAREKSLARSREIIRNSASAIRSIHRGEYEEALSLMDENQRLLHEVGELLRPHPKLYQAGFFQDAQKEYAEARQTYALIRREPLPDPDALAVTYAAYLNGLGEAIGELRRHALDRIRHSDTGWGEGILGVMDEVYYALVSFDYPPAICGGLKRTADITRSLIERTRGDITNAIRQQRLEASLADVEGRLHSEED